MFTGRNNHERGRHRKTTITTRTDIVTYLVTHGFTRLPGSDWWRHITGRARVKLGDGGSVEIYAQSAVTSEYLWAALLTFAPLSVVATAITAAVAR
jgi:hypothetical protein